MTAQTSATTRPATREDTPDEALDYLVVDEFLRTLIGSRALKSALDLGVIDELHGSPTTVAALAASRGGDEPGMELLTGLLAAEGVVEAADGTVRLTSRFTHALGYRELLERKLDFIGFVLLDFVDHFDALVVDPARFMRSAQLFRLFDYRRASQSEAENYAWTKVWMRLTTALTRHEAGVCLRHHDFGRYRRMLDIGGNSGEFVLQACKAHPELRATVMDLPVVCEFAQDHVLAEPQHERISFVAGSALEKPIPAGYDLISFKSMLHDWPEDKAVRFVERAAEALEPGGTLLIFERAPLDFGAGTPPLSLLPMLLFARYFRSPALYVEKLEAMAFGDIEVQDLRLESPFFLITATKPAA